MDHLPSIRHCVLLSQRYHQKHSSPGSRRDAVHMRKLWMVGEGKCIAAMQLAKKTVKVVCCREAVLALWCSMFLSWVEAVSVESCPVSTHSSAGQEGWIYSILGTHANITLLSQDSQT